MTFNDPRQVNNEKETMEEILLFRITFIVYYFSYWNSQFVKIEEESKLLTNSLEILVF